MTENNTQSGKNMISDLISPVRHGLFLAVTAMILGVSWAAYLATHHEQLHGGFEKQEAAIKAADTQQKMKGVDMHGMSLGAATELLIPQAHGSDETQHGSHAGAKHQHSHSGSLATDAMQRLLRGHIHWMGLGILSAIMLLITAFTSLKPGWKTLLGWTFGLGALAYPIAWILMGFRTVAMGPEVAEASVMWLFGPAAGVLLASLGGIFGVLLLEMTGLYASVVFSRFFEPTKLSGE